VNIALVVTREGMPLGYEIFPGNKADVTTVEEIVAAMEARFGKANRVWVMDRGMASADNLAWLNETGRRYVIGTPKAELKRWLKQIEERTDWRHIRDDVEVKICRGPDSEETFLLCRSASRIDKERAMHSRFKARIDAGLDSLERRIAKSTHALERGPIERQIGRLLERNSRAAGAFAIAVVEEPSHPSGIRLQRSYRSDWAEWANLTEGLYILRTNITEWTDEALWQTYIQLTEAEAAFRVHKSDLAMRPIWHHKAERIKAHILICFIAYALWKTLQQWQSRAGLGHAPRTILEEFSRISAADVVLPLADASKRELRIRCVVRPEREQQILLDHLGLQLPQRLKPPATTEM
jgi:transposase